MTASILFFLLLLATCSSSSSFSSAQCPPLFLFSTAGIPSTCSVVAGTFRQGSRTTISTSSGPLQPCPVAASNASNAIANAFAIRSLRISTNTTLQVAVQYSTVNRYQNPTTLVSSPLVTYTRSAIDQGSGYLTFPLNCPLSMAAGVVVWLSVTVNGDIMFYETLVATSIPPVELLNCDISLMEFPYCSSPVATPSVPPSSTASPPLSAPTMPPMIGSTAAGGSTNTTTSTNNACGRAGECGVRSSGGTALFALCVSVLLALT
jgi:hypothetical protein